MRYNKTRTINMTPPYWTEEDRLAYKWCITNGIKISPDPVKSGYNEEFKISISIDNSIITSPIAYGPKNLYPKMLEIYRFYYDKYNKNE